MTERDRPIETHDAERRQTRRALAALVVFVLALAAIGAGAASWRLYAAQYDDSQANLRRFALAVTEQTAWELNRLDSILQLASTWLGRSEKLDAYGSSRLQERVQPRLTGLPAAQSIIVSTDEGTLRMVTRDTTALPITGFDPRPLFEYFRAHPDAGLTIGAPFKLAGTDKWAFPISRPIITGKGTLTGAVTLVVDAPVLAERFRVVRPTTDHHVALLRIDGVLMIDDADRASVARESFLGAGASNPIAEGDRDRWITADGTASLAYLQRVGDFPLVVAVSLPRSVVTDSIRPALIVISGVIAAAGLGLAFIAVILGRRILLSQARLRQQRDFVTRVLDSADVMVFVQDAAGRLVSCNAEAEKLGYPQTEILALDPFMHLVPREEREMVAAARRRARRAAAPELYECHLLTRAGERRLIRWSTTNLPDATGRRDWVLSVGTDVTEERAQQDEIARNNAIMDRAQSIAHMCYWTAKSESATGDWATSTFIYSANLEVVFGQSLAEIDVPLAEFIERFVHPDDQVEMTEAYRSFYEGREQRLAITFRFKQRDGSYRYIRDFAEKRVDASGALVELIGLSQDVTQQMAADAMLRESEIKLRRAHRLAKLCYWTYDPIAASSGGGERLVFSGDAEEILGAPAADLNSANASPLIAMAHPEDRDRILNEWRAFMASTETAWTFEYRLARSDGEIRDVSVSAEKVVNNRGPLGQVIGVVQDITDRKRNERAIARNETLLRHAHRLSRVGYWVWEPRDVAQSADRGWLHLSSEFADILGARPEDIPLEEIDLVRKFVHPDDQAFALAAVEGFVNRTTDRYDAQFRVVRPDQSIAHVHMEAERLRDAQGRILYEIGVIQDVTEQRERELELLTAKRTAEIANRTKTQFLANMSHELRTPLNAVIGFSQLICDQAFGKIPERYVNYANDINSSGKLLLALINDILDMSRIEAGQQKLMEEVISVDSVINDCVRMVTSKAADGGVRLIVENKGPLPALRADERALKQILLNLLSNAVKFTPQGGAVTVAAEVTKERKLDIAISDTGIGIAEDVLRDLFQPFRQADASISRRFGGSGLGLAISKKLMELHGGDIAINSQPGRGTRVTLHMPAERVIQDADADARLQA
ncbi:PAS domain-containing protein [Dongia deserti]|uniref:PAS domain-containing protein n=1 Tax=Dongia deserti TaxID=2268030 RepID=UPI000E64A35C|nr:PAS domain-containing protein [Dongia deserti]